ncbi:uncharacterized protein K02A2.6-like [Melanotaenia boesemani]|uniref:uncharacterized protein K02A2.6-like n=1 Tax=Melanotaenia boesemani TaxID=1250792 RepID=UPI001C05E292|nr:uncharacterized protein K02A2.6-like [Melanotaenia boesemani]
MATIGTLVAFDAKTQSWEEYCEIMEQFFEANGIDDGDKQRAILLSVVGAATYSLIRNLLSPEKPKEKTYQQLVTLLKNHFDPKPSEIVQRYKFDSRSRKPDESVMDYVAELPVAAETVSRNAQDLQNPSATVKCFKLTNDPHKSGAFKGGTKEKAKTPRIRPVRIKLESYTGDPIRVVGAAEVQVRYKKQRAKLPLVVVKGNGPTLLGRGWLEDIHLNWPEIRNRFQNSQVHQVKTKRDAPQELQPTLQDILCKHEEVFKEELGTLRGTKATIHVADKAVPRFFRPRSLPYAMKAKVDEELDRLLREEIITPVKYSEWAAPVVPILKPTGSVRLCGDYKLTVNTVSALEQYPIPRVEDLFATLSHGKQFSKLDMSHAYQQIVMDEDSKKYLTVNTHRGLFTYNRLPFGVASAPATFQRTMESLLSGVPMVAVYLDDILVSGVDKADHLRNLDSVLKRLKESGLRLRRNKCTLLQDEVEYLGYRVDAQGLHPVAKKVKAIQEAPAPTNVTELKSFLGLLNYYHRFLPNLATELAPLHVLLRQEVGWKWNREQEKAFEKAKNMLNTSDVLVHYSADRELILSCDASPYGIGAVFSHIMEDGHERPVGFVSRTLQPAETKYSQLDKEGLAVMFGVEKFHKYLYGRTFTIYTDHKPLIYLFGENKQIPQMGSPRVQRWAVRLSAYQYKIVYKPGKQHANEDALSRLPVPENSKGEERTEQVLMMDMLDESLVQAEQVKSWTARDVVLSKVHEYVLSGWPVEVESDLKPFYQRKLELSVRDGCVLWGARVIIPSKGREKMLRLLHQTHSGTSKMKGLAQGCPTRSYMWWPGMDLDVEKTVQACQECQAQQKAPTAAPLHPWEWPETPWARIHIDYAGPFLGEMFLVIVDAHSKWLDIYPMKTSTSQATIEKLRMSFSVFGLPKVLVSDNGACFTSSEFETFLKQNGIQHVKSAPFHPSSNGLAERAVQSFKEGMKKLKDGTIQTRVSRFLFSYRITPHATTGLAPAELMMSRRLRSVLDLVVPDIKTRVQQKQFRQKVNHDKHRKLRSFAQGDDVLVRNYSYGPKWIPGVIHDITRPVSYSVRVGGGKVIKGHVDQVRSRFPVPVSRDELEHERVSLPEMRSVVEGSRSAEMAEQPSSGGKETEKSPLSQDNPIQEDLPLEPEVRCSTRERRSPAHLRDYVC